MQPVLSADDQHLIRIANNGPRIVETNYFDLPHARAGLFFVSVNAGTFRILVPDNQLSAIAEMRSGPKCVISRGPLGDSDAIELMFDDGSDSPFALHIDARQVDRLLGYETAEVVVTAWTRDGLAATWPGYYRAVPTLPCLDPWPTPDDPDDLNIAP